MRTLIPGLSGTTTHQLGVRVYRAHHDNGAGVCARCARRHPCPQRRNAAELVVSADDDPHRYDPTYPEAYGRQTYPTYDGFHVGGRSRPPLDSAGYQYERDNG